jgi:hypothetical protein
LNSQNRKMKNFKPKKFKMIKLKIKIKRINQIAM